MALSPLITAPHTQAPAARPPLRALHLSGCQVLLLVVVVVLLLWLSLRALHLSRCQAHLDTPLFLLSIRPYSYCLSDYKTLPPFVLSIRPYDLWSIRQ